MGRWQGHGAAPSGVPASQQRRGLRTWLATGSSLWGLNWGRSGGVGWVPKAALQGVAGPLLPLHGLKEATCPPEKTTFQGLTPCSPP